MSYSTLRLSSKTRSVFSEIRILNCINCINFCCCSNHLLLSSEFLLFNSYSIVVKFDARTNICAFVTLSFIAVNRQSFYSQLLLLFLYNNIHQLIYFMFALQDLLIEIEKKCWHLQQSSRLILPDPNQLCAVKWTEFRSQTSGMKIHHQIPAMWPLHSAAIIV